MMQSISILLREEDQACMEQKGIKRGVRSQRNSYFYLSKGSLSVSAHRPFYSFLHS